MRYVATGDPDKDKRQLDERWGREMNRRASMHTLRDFLAHDQIPSTPAMPHETAEHLGQREQFAAALFSLALERRASLYAIDPQRSGVGRDWERAQYRRPVFNLTMQEIDREAALTGAPIAVVLRDREEDYGAVNNTAEADVATVYVFGRDRYTALDHPDDKRRIGAVRILWSARDFHGSTNETYRYIMWTPDAVVDILYTVGQEPVIDFLDYWPIAVLPECYTTDTWDAHARFGPDDEQSVKTINQLWDVLAQCSRLQVGRNVLIGELKDGDLTIGVDAVVHLEAIPGSSFTCVRPASDILGQIDAIQAMLDALAMGWGLPPRTFKIGTKQMPASAAVIVAQEHEMRADRKRRSTLALYWEQQIHAIASAALGGSLRWRTLRLRFPEPQIPLTNAEARETANTLHDRLVIDRQEVGRRLLSDVSDEDLQTMADRAVVEADAAAERTARTAGHAGRPGDSGEPGRPMEIVGDDKPMELESDE